MHSPPPVYTPIISDIIYRFEAQNTAISSVNGLATATIKDPKGTKRYRLAWALEKPNKLRLIVLFSGRPVETILYNGTFLVIKSHNGSHELIKKRTKNPNLKKLISLPIRVDRMISILAGDIHLPLHRSANLEHNPDGGFILTLLKGSSQAVATYNLNGEKNLISCEFTDKNDTIYHIRYTKDLIPMMLPDEIMIRNKDRSLDLRIDQLNPNASLSSETFKIITD